MANTSMNTSTYNVIHKPKSTTPQAEPRPLPFLPSSDHPSCPPASGCPAHVLQILKANQRLLPLRNHLSKPPQSTSKHLHPQVPIPRSPTHSPPPADAGNATTLPTAPLKPSAIGSLASQLRSHNLAVSRGKPNPKLNTFKLQKSPKTGQVVARWSSRKTARHGF